jgi:hypothetical protein
MIGAKLAPRIALLVKHVMDEHLRQSGHHRAKIGAQAGVEFWKTVSAERDAHWGPMLERLLDHPDHPDWFQKAMGFVRHGQGEGAAMAALSVAQGAASSTIGQVLAAELAPVIHRDLAGLQTGLLDPSVVASLAARRVVGTGRARSEGAGNNLSGEKIDRMIEGSESWPGLAEALELLRRGKASAEEVVDAMRHNGIREEWIGPLLALRERPLDPADVSLMVLKGIIGEDEAQSEAAQAGLDHDRLHKLILMTGEPPGLEQMMEAFRRGLIDEARFDKAVRQSRVRDEWKDVLLKLRFQPASPADAIRGAVQGHISETKAKQIAELGSLRGEDFQWMFETAGNPPGPMTMIELWRRGDATQAQVEQAIREGRTKNKYIPNLVHLKRVLPPQRTVVTMLSHGAITETEAARLLHEHGYDDVTVKGYILAATSSTSIREKQLARAEVVELYYDHAISEAEAIKHLRMLGYTASTAKIVLGMADLKRERALQQAAMSPIRSAYIGRHIDAAEASLRLDGVGVPHAQRDLALRLWAVDREAHTKQLTEAQIVKANTQGLLTDVQAEERLLTLGYDRTDARILLDMEKGRSTPAP